MKFRTGGQKFYRKGELYPPFAVVEVASYTEASGKWTPLDEEAKAALIRLKQERVEKFGQAATIKKLEAEIAALKKMGAAPARPVEHYGPAGVPPTPPVVDDREKKGEGPKEPAGPAMSELNKAGTVADDEKTTVVTKPHLQPGKGRASDKSPV